MVVDVVDDTETVVVLVMLDRTAMPMLLPVEADLVAEVGHTRQATGPLPQPLLRPRPLLQLRLLSL